jgi:hypothetical protein
MSGMRKARRTDRRPGFLTDVTVSLRDLVVLLLVPKAYWLEVLLAIFFLAGLRGAALIAHETLESGLEGAVSRLLPMRSAIAISFAYLPLPLVGLYRRNRQ